MPIWNRAVMPAEPWPARLHERLPKRLPKRWAKRRVKRWARTAPGLLLGGGLAIGAATSTVMAADEAEPEMELLEYLGMWEETDEEWLMFDQPGAEEAGDAADSEADAPEPLETEDER